MKAKVIFILTLGFICCSPKTQHVSNARKFISQWNYDRALIEILKYREDKDAEIQYLLGYCYFGKNEFSQAKDYFRNSLVIDSFFQDSIIGLYTTAAKKALRISDLSKALQFYKTLAELIPSYEQADNLFLVADLNFQQGNYPAAMQAYLDAFSIDSVSETATRHLRNFLKVLVECDSLERARAIALRLYRRSKTSENLLILGEINYLVGLRLFNTGNLDSATFFFREVILNQEPKSLIDDAAFYLGEIYFAQEKFDQALEYYKKVIRLNPYQKGELVLRSQERIKEMKEKK